MKGKYPENPTHHITDIRDLFLQSTRKYADRIALQYKKDGRWIPILYRELRTAVEETACGLAALGLQPVEGKLAIVGDNRPEWAVSYLSAATTGIVCIPIDRDLRETEVYHILYLSGAQAIVADGKHIEMILEIRRKLPRLSTVINMDEADERDGVHSFRHLRALGCGRMALGKNDFEQRDVTPDHLLSILFTSGTMGNSKGVMLSHGNVAVNIVDAVKWVNLQTEDRFLSVLPMHHSYECTDGFLLSLYRGSLTSYAENLRRIAENMAETKSTAVLGVPLLWHAIYRKIAEAMVENGMWKVNAAKKLASISEKVLRRQIRRKIFAKVHEKFGGCVRILISGGAAVDPEVARGFRELGFTFLQGYGLTESAPIISVNRDFAFKDDAAGLPLPSVEVTIADDGEVLARGPNIMKGYYNNPEATAETIVDGWLYTGDLGYLDEDGFLHIQGRKKAVIVTPGGKKIYPEEVEAELMKSPYILECLVWGETPDNPSQEVEVQAILVPNTEYFINQGLEKMGAVDSARVEEILQREVKERCQNLAPFKRVTRVTIRYEEFEKTTTKKIKRYLYVAKPRMVGAQKR
ncbi:MAG TPA: AMP-binding protein [Acidobacteriota bacterium]|nr:AMP-binding protein [Acidobacteriota bacterium]